MSPKIEQTLAVFGESGSGKTVLLSSLYGAATEPDAAERDGFRVIAMDVNQGDRLRSQYLGMKKTNRVPRTTMFKSTPYRFRLRPLGEQGDAAPDKGVGTFDLVWHDYPGEWFTSTPEDQTEQARRVDTFRILMRSHMALLLVDGQRLAEHRGEESRYLKALFSNYANVLAAMREEIVDGDDVLKQFPRIWVVGLSKADLLPDLDVQGFRDLLHLHAAGEIGALRDAIHDCVERPDATSVAEDFVLLSSGKFKPDAIDLHERVGVDLIFPMTALMPLERMLRWQQRHQIPAAAVRHVLDGAQPIADALGAMGGQGTPDIEPLRLLKKVAAVIRTGNVVLDLGRSRLEKMAADAGRKGQLLKYLLARFGLRLDAAERERILHRSERGT
ncbi:TRAFAC clade GTPase domain-containing protein [Micrococcus endophyticus]|uniref:TRAFAC clade GTPase domain-containing protein n=1 Tax=Micrococcus endophyticus TaxID=455343 RepID=UPI0020060F6D|nr:ATP/GTP-binding protein [Micrococcus endophyticus]MCK6091505.1 ATP/GTP-binding protein [Micrococcus endophyticus]